MICKSRMEEVISRLKSLRLNDRSNCIKQLVEQASDNDNNSIALLPLLIEGFLKVDKSSQKIFALGIERLLSANVNSIVALKGALGVVEAKNISLVERKALLQIFCLILRSLSVNGTASLDFLYFKIFDLINVESEVAKKSIDNSLRKIVFDHAVVAKLLGEYITQNPHSAHTFLLLPCLSTWKSLSPELYSGIKFLFLEGFRKKLAASVTVVTELCQSRWMYLIDELTDDDWLDKNGLEGIETLLVKAVKKSPESLSNTISSILNHLRSSINVDGMVTQGSLGLCLRMLKSENSEVKSAGVNCILHMVSRTKSAELIESCFSQLIDSLFGKFPGIAVVSIPQEHQKIAILSALRVSGTCGLSLLTPQERENCLKKIVQNILPYFEKEKDLNYLILSSSVVGDIISKHLLTSAVAQDIVNPFVSMLEKTTLVAGFTIRTCSLILFSKVISQVNNVVSLCPTLSLKFIDVVKEIFKKPTGAHLDGILAIGVLSSLAVFDSTVRDAIGTMKLSNFISSKSSFYYNETIRTNIKKSSDGKKALYHFFNGTVGMMNVNGLAHSLTYREVVLNILNSFSSLFELGLLDLFNNSSASAPDRSTSNEIGSLVFDCLFATTDLEIFGHSELKDLAFLKSPNALLMLSSTLWSRAVDTELRISQLHLKASDGKDSEAPSSPQSLSFTLFSMHYKNAVRLLLSQMPSNLSVEVHGSLMSHLILVLGSGLISTASQLPLTFWNVHCKPTLMINLSPSLAQSVVEALFHQAIEASSFRQNAALAALRILESTQSDSQDFVQQVLNKWFDCCHSKIERCPLFDLSRLEVLSFSNPESALTMISESAQTNQSALSDIEITNSDRKKAVPRSQRRGQFGGDQSDELEWAEKVKKEKAAKLEQMNSEKQSETDLARDECNRKKSKVVQAIDFTKRVLDAVAVITKLSQATVPACLFVLLKNDALWQLLRSELISDYLFRVLNSLIAVAVPAQIADSFRYFFLSISLQITVH